MKNFKIFVVFFLQLGIFGAVSAQNVPIDFEETGNGATWTWTVFENDSDPTLEIVENPDISGINHSSTVAKFTALTTGNPWAGCESLHGGGIGQFVMDASTSIIKIMVWKPVISDVGIKLVRSDNWSLGEIKIPNTKVNEWELLTFDFTAHIGNDYDQIVIFPDFDLNGRTSDNVIYFDNILGLDSIPGTDNASADELPNFDFDIHPNPTNDLMNIESNSNIDGISIFNLLGNLVYSGEGLDTTVTVDLSAMESSVYLVEVVSGNKSIRKKIIKN
ncbi:T9SS type A sorting domain-containing protein [Crocinitomicaceae bacterium]|nr:T9SS type A sorting domain-containing protein [Crocinitomicaceae bacterium]